MSYGVLSNVACTHYLLQNTRFALFCTIFPTPQLDFWHTKWHADKCQNLQIFMLLHFFFLSKTIFLTCIFFESIWVCTRPKNFKKKKVTSEYIFGHLSQKKWFDTCPGPNWHGRTRDMALWKSGKCAHFSRSAFPWFFVFGAITHLLPDQITFRLGHYHPKSLLCPFFFFVKT